MIAEELIDASYPVLKSTDLAEKALDLMEETGFVCLPVVNEGVFLGFLFEDTIHTLFETNVAILNLKLSNIDCLVKNTDHWYEVLRKASVFNSNIVSVVNHAKQLVGIIRMESIFNRFYGMTAFKNPGGIIVLQLEHREYSLADISRVVESNGAKILSAILSEDDNTNNFVFLTLKLNLDELTRVIAGLERYHYNIVGQFHQAEFENIDKQRLDNFFKFINI